MLKHVYYTYDYMLKIRMILSIGKYHANASYSVLSHETTIGTKDLKESSLTKNEFHLTHWGQDPFGS